MVGEATKHEVKLLSVVAINVSTTFCD